MGIGAILTRTCRQTAVYWQAPTPDGYGGFEFDSAYPQEIDCRWEQRVELIKTSAGEEKVSRARVFLTQDVEEGGFLFLGTLDDLDSDVEEDPKKDKDIHEILRFDKTQAMKPTTDYIRIAYL